MSILLLGIMESLDNGCPRSTNQVDRPNMISLTSTNTKILYKDKVPKKFVLISFYLVYKPMTIREQLISIYEYCTLDLWVPHCVGQCS